MPRTEGSFDFDIIIVIGLIKIMSSIKKPGAVEYLHFILGAVLQLDDAAIGGIEDGFQGVSMVDVMAVNTAGALLRNGLGEFLLGNASKIAIQQIGTVLLQTRG
jgi:hypothetical protein